MGRGGVARLLSVVVDQIRTALVPPLVQLPLLRRRHLGRGGGGGRGKRGVATVLLSVAYSGGEKNAIQIRTFASSSISSADEVSRERTVDASAAMAPLAIPRLYAFARRQLVRAGMEMLGICVTRRVFWGLTPKQTALRQWRSGQWRSAPRCPRPAPTRRES